MNTEFHGNPPKYTEDTRQVVHTISPVVEYIATAHSPSHATMLYRALAEGAVGDTQFSVMPLAEWLTRNAHRCDICSEVCETDTCANCAARFDPKTGRERLEQSPTAPTIYVYRSPYREMPLGYLPEEIAKSWDYDHSDIGAWTPQTRYAFTVKIPNGIVRQWDLEAVV